MYRLLLVLLLAFPVWAQEADDADTKADEESSPESVESVTESAEDDLDDDLDLDELYPEEDDDGFIPSEDVKFGQSIPFPTDI